MHRPAVSASIRHGRGVRPAHRFWLLCYAHGDKTSAFHASLSGAHAGVIPSEDFLNGTVGASYVAADGMWYAHQTAQISARM